MVSYCVIFTELDSSNSNTQNSLIVTWITERILAHNTVITTVNCLVSLFFLALKVQADVASNCSTSDEDDESETNDSSGTSQKAENSIISSGIDETPPQNGPEGLQKIDNLVPSAMPVPLRPPMINASSNMPTEAGNMSNLLINSSNRNSATSLDSGRGSAYATSSEGLKLVSISFFLKYHKSVMPFHENIRFRD